MISLPYTVAGTVKQFINSYLDVSIVQGKSSRDFVVTAIFQESSERWQSLIFNSDARLKNDRKIATRIHCQSAIALAYNFVLLETKVRLTMNGIENVHFDKEGYIHVLVF